MMGVKKGKAVSFEEAMAELETIVASLEKGEGTLDESIVLFTRGMELTGLCNDILKTIEGKITKLTVDSNELADVNINEALKTPMIETPFKLADN